MAQVQIDRSDEHTKPMKRARKAVILHPNSVSGRKAVLCTGTGMLTLCPFWTDRAAESFSFISPLVAVITLENMLAMTISANPEDRERISKAFPGVNERMIKSMLKRLRVAKNFNELSIETQAELIKGRGGPGFKFNEALNQLLRDCPLLWSPGSTDAFLPFSMALDHGWSHADLILALNDLVEKERPFVDRWGWHCQDLRQSADELFNRRTIARSAPQWTFEMLSPDGTALHHLVFGNLGTARMEGLLLMGKHAKKNRPTADGVWRSLACSALNKDGLHNEEIFAGDLGTGGPTIAVIYRRMDRLAKIALGKELTIPKPVVEHFKLQQTMKQLDRPKEEEQAQESDETDFPSAFAIAEQMSQFKLPEPRNAIVGVSSPDDILFGGLSPQSDPDPCEVLPPPAKKRRVGLFDPRDDAHKLRELTDDMAR